jgi:archaellum biogenesis ATPase FlaH
VSGFVIEHHDTTDCAYRKPPENLGEMKELIMENISLVNPNIIVVDSLSQFINFSMPKDDEIRNLYKFLKSIKEDAMGLTRDAIILIYDDKMGSMKKLPTLFTDLILKLEVIKEEYAWADRE